MRKYRNNSRNNTVNLIASMFIEAAVPLLCFEKVTASSENFFKKKKKKNHTHPKNQLFVTN